MRLLVSASRCRYRLNSNVRPQTMHPSGHSWLLACIAEVAGQSEHCFCTLAEGSYTVFCRRQNPKLKARENIVKAGADANCHGVRTRGKTMKDTKTMKPRTVALLAPPTHMAKIKNDFGAFGRKCLDGFGPARLVHSVYGPAMLVAAAQHRKLRSNPSFKPSPGSVARRPSSAGPAAHCALAVQRATLSVPA